MSPLCGTGRWAITKKTEGGTSFDGILLLDPFHVCDDHRRQQAWRAVTRVRRPCNGGSSRGRGRGVEGDRRLDVHRTSGREKMRAAGLGN